MAGALSAAKIKVDGNDKLSVRPTAKLVDGTSVRYVRVTESKVTRKVSLAYKTVRKETAKLDKGDTKVDTRGAKGVRTLTYQVVRHDGKTVSKKRTSDKVTKKPVTQVVLVGTKEEPKRRAPAVAAARPRRPLWRRAACGTGWPSASRAATGRSTPATATTADCSSR